MIGPGATIGIVGGGQLGRMLGLAAAQLGYRTHIFDPHERPCAADVASAHSRAAFDDVAALERFAAAVDIATYEFENLPAGPLAVLGGKLRPGTRSLVVAQDRAEEKAFITSCGARVAPWAPVTDLADVRRGVTDLGLPLVLKTRRYGYDGKGQAWISAAADVDAAWAAIGGQPAIAEAAVPFAAEFSIILARGADGAQAFWDAPENVHENGILRSSTVPARATVQGQVKEARRYALAIAEALDHVGVLTVEFFASADGPVVNEIAPRVHNSGHWTIEGALTSQFEQHIRAICGLPLGATTLTANGAAMRNLIGDEAGAWQTLVDERGLHVHLYGKGEARAGRKMGHTTRLAL